MSGLSEHENLYNDILEAVTRHSTEKEITLVRAVLEDVNRINASKASKQMEEVIECLISFVKRVSSGEGAISPAEVAALPEIARLLLERRWVAGGNINGKVKMPCL